MVQITERIRDWEEELKNYDQLLIGQTAIYKSLMLLRRNNSDFASDSLFRAAYCYFYDIKTYMSEPENNKWLENYFTLMTKYTKPDAPPVEENEIEAVIKTINGNGKRNLSFASKLLHTVNPSLPIWDGNLKEALKDHLNEKNDLTNYLKLKTVLEDELVKNQTKINDFDERYKVGNKLKSLDFILWALGKIDKKNKRI